LFFDLYIFANGGAVFMESLRIDGARVVLRNEVLETSLFIEAGLIQEIGTQTKADRSIDARGRLLAPGLIDIHGDAFERVMMPREGVLFRWT
jgi:alpha-D-ribose 1-methylphosphonate 5-triphosphate diphosphatase